MPMYFERLPRPAAVAHIAVARINEAEPPVTKLHNSSSNPVGKPLVVKLQTSESIWSRGGDASVLRHPVSLCHESRRTRPATTAPSPALFAGGGRLGAGLRESERFCDGPEFGGDAGSSRVIGR